MKKTILLILVFNLGLTTEIVKADFVFGTPTNLGPTVNSSGLDITVNISADGLSLFFTSDRSGGSGGLDIWVTTRATVDDPWGEPENLGSLINSSGFDFAPCVSADGLTLYFNSDKPGGFGGQDIYVTTRATKNDPWEEPVNLGAPINTSANETMPSISCDGLELYFSSSLSGGVGQDDIYVAMRATTDSPWSDPVNLMETINTSDNDGFSNISADGLILFFGSLRGGGMGGEDIWMSKRITKDHTWGVPINPGSPVNTSANDGSPSLSSDGTTLYLKSNRPGGLGQVDIWQVPIEPVVDLNGDGKVDPDDMHIMVDHWGENYPLCDIGPTPLGDGVVDIHDFIVLSEHLYRLTAHWKLDETDGSIAYDSFGDYDGTINGNPSWMPTGGMKDGYLMLDGMDDYIETPFILDPSKGSFSVFAWVYCWMPGQVIISQKGLSGGTWLGTNPSGMLMTGFDDVNFGALESESFITDVQWHHVGFVYDTDTLHRRLYVDGILVAEDTSAIVGESSNDGLYIGASKDLGAGTLFSGFIDDIRVYKQALTAKEIAALAQ